MPGSRVDKRRWRITAPRGRGEPWARPSVSGAHRSVPRITLNGPRRGERWVGDPVSRTESGQSMTRPTVAAPDSRIESGALTGELARSVEEIGITRPKARALETRCRSLMRTRGRGELSAHAGRCRILSPPACVSCAPRCLSDHAARAADVANHGSATRWSRTRKEHPERTTTHRTCASADSRR